MNKKALLTSLICVFVLSACNSAKEQKDLLPIYSDNIESIEMLNWLTGEKAEPSTTNWSVGGTDLGIPAYDSTHNRMFYAFGDTYSGSYYDDATRAGGWRSNVIGYDDDFDIKKGVHLDGFLTRVEDPNYAKPIIGRVGISEIEVTTIPTGLIFVGETMYMFYMSVRLWGVGGVWDCSYGGCYKSDDYGENWSQVRDLIWTDSNSANVQFLTGLTKEEAESRIAPNFMQIFPVFGNDGYIYLYGIPGGRLGGVKLMRVTPDKFESFLDYEYFTGLNGDGTPKFVKGNEGRIQAFEDSAYILDPQVGEVSVMYNNYLQKWIMITIFGNRGIYISYSNNPWGQWSTPNLVISEKDFELAYCGFMHEKLTEQNGKVIYFIMSQYIQYNASVVKLEFK